MHNLKFIQNKAYAYENNDLLCKELLQCLNYIESMKF